MLRLRLLTVVLLASSGVASAASPAIKIDISPDNGRHDAAAPGMLDWRFPKSNKDAHFDASGVTIAFENSPGLKCDMWKGGYGYKAPMASDGAIAPSGGL